ncbi:hypothetical protein EVAR_51266_1 [Eumeta japonica]|uniref:DUF4219 domain-containing protein n=1 Tax=Eumeta variegata TaxID=151549 RepID=A0A4C1YBY9_EUMVA|nr:hypothetical protein EVAR_51266_1 [Eumeta japonica]
MASSNPLALIEKLTGRENYNTWRFAVKTYLQHEELWECIENPKDEPIDKKKDMKAKSKIILLVDSINYVHIQEAETAKVGTTSPALSTTRAYTQSWPT